MSKIYVIIESYVDIDGSTDTTYLGYVDSKLPTTKVRWL